MIYNCVDQDDPAIVKLAGVIDKNGYDPLVITLDNYIIAGHRRRLALMRNGVKWVNCRVRPERRDSMPKDDFIRLLREHNEQRHKSPTEQIHEEIIDTNPDET